MPHQTQKNPKVKNFIIHLNSMPWKQKIQEWWQLRIKVKVQQQRSLIMTIQECTWNFLWWKNWLNNTPHQIQKHVTIINKFKVVCQEWKKGHFKRSPLEIIYHPFSKEHVNKIKTQITIYNKFDTKVPIFTILEDP
jgi:hypothetical protein